VPASRPAFPAVAPGLLVLAGARAPIAGSRRDAAVVGLVKGIGHSVHLFQPAGGRGGERAGKGPDQRPQYRAQTRLADRDLARSGPCAAGARPPVPARVGQRDEGHQLHRLQPFLNNPDADAATPRTAEQRYAGYLTVFAHGDCWGDVGHCDIPEPVSAFDRRPPHPLVPFDATLEISEPLQALSETIGPDGAGEITVTVLAFNEADDTDGVLRFKELTLLTYA